jgi:lipopolysaccharide biosynthesis glycosyltransferase
MWRERDAKQSTDFAFNRFLPPYLCGYQGWSAYMDCDMLVRTDIKALFDQGRDKYAVHVVKHEYSPKPEDKFLGQAQTIYARKNWSSVMLFNNAACRLLTLQNINWMPGLELHQFRWLDDAQIGELPREWNHLVGEYEPNPNASIAHFTRGTPCFPEYRDCEFAEEWRAELHDMLKPEAA